MVRNVRLDVDDNASAWHATARYPDPLPALQGDVQADVVVIGGGFTGISTAWHLSQRHPSKRIVLLEAKRLGNGASGRNGGMALNWINGVDASGPERTQRVFGVTLRGLDWIAGVIRDHQLDVRFRRIGCLETYTSAERGERAHAKAEKLASWGLPLRYLRGAELAEKVDAVGVVGAVLDPTAGQLHGLDLIHGLRPLLLARGVALHEHSPVTRIEEGRTHVVTTATGSVRAPTLVLATNGYTGRLGYFGTGIFPLHSHVIATEPLSKARWRELGWGDTAGFTDDLDRIAYASMSEDGRLVFGGGGNLAYDYRYGSRTAFTGPVERQFAFVEDMLHKYFPGTRDVAIAQRWTGTLGITMHRVCSMGVTGDHQNVLYALGYSGHGVVLANLAGEVLADLYDDHHEPWRDLPFYQRRIAGMIPGEPLRWVGYKLFTSVTGRSPRRYEAD